MSNSKTEVLSRKPLETETKYAYCPYCYREKKAALKSFEIKDVLPKLIQVKTKEMYLDKEGKLQVIFDSHYHCENCARDITVEDFYRFYIAKPDGSPYYPPLHKKEQ